MNRVSEIVLSFLLNATWQIAVIALVASVSSWLLRNVAARYRHFLWVGALLLSVVLPVWSFSPTSINDTAQPSTNERIDNPSRSNPSKLEFPTNAADTPRPTEQGIPPGRLMQRQTRQLSAPTSLFAVLTIGYVLFLLYRLKRFVQAWRKAKGLAHIAYQRDIPLSFAVALNRCKAAFGVQKVELRFSKSVLLPVTLGMREPLIIMPDTFIVEQSEETLLSVFGHEMAHIARKDWALSLLYEVLWLPISFHPLANLIKRQIEKTRELACDDLVAEHLLERVAYARSLVRVADRLVSPAAQSLTLGMFDADILEERITKLTHKQRRFGARLARCLTLSAFLFLCFVCTAISTLSFDLRLQNANAGQYANPSGNSRSSLNNVNLNDDRSTNGSQDANIVDPAQTNETKALTSSDPQARATAACSAGKNRHIDLIPQLISMLGDDASVQQVRCWDNDKWSPSMETFKHPSPGEQAAIALASMGSSAFVSLTNALNDENPSVRRNAAWAIGELTNMRPGERSGAVPSLISFLTDSDEWIRMAAAQALGELRDYRASEMLIATLSDRHPRVRNIAAWALGELRDEQAVAALCKVLLEDIQPEVRQGAAIALGEIKSPKAIQSLRQALLDPEQRVRSQAQSALNEIEDSNT